MAWTPKFTFTVTWDNVSGKPVTATRWPTWGEVTGKPSIPAGTVTSISAGNGMNFTTITGSGTVTLGTPGTLGRATGNSVSAGSHTHALDDSVFSDRPNLGAEDIDNRFGQAGYATVTTSANATTDRNYPWNGGGGSLMTFVDDRRIYQTQIFHRRSGDRIAFRARRGEGDISDWNEFYHTGNFDPESKVDTESVSVEASPNSVVQRSASQDIQARLFRSEFASQGTVGSGVSFAFRNNDSTDNYIRFVSSNNAVRGWLGLGTAATSSALDFAAAGNTITAGNGLSGGGNLADSRTISLATPGTLSRSTTNSVTASSHTHALSANLSAWDAITPSAKANTSHTHAAGDINSGTLNAARIPSLAISKVSGLQGALDGKASAGDFDYVGGVSGGTYDAHGSSSSALSYFFHSAGSAPSDSPTGQQTSVLHLANIWGRSQIAIPNNNPNRMYFRANDSSWAEVFSTSNQPRIFVQSGNPGNGASDGDLWVW